MSTILQPVGQRKRLGRVIFKMIESKNDDEKLDRRNLDGNRFKIDTTVNIAHILTTIGMIVALFTWGTDVKTALATNRSEIDHLKTERTREARELRDSIHELNIKIDRLIERGMPPINYGLGSRRQYSNP